MLHLRVLVWVIFHIELINTSTYIAKIKDNLWPITDFKTKQLTIAKFKNIYIYNSELKVFSYEIARTNLENNFYF